MIGGRSASSLRHRALIMLGVQCISYTNARHEADCAMEGCCEDVPFLTPPNGMHTAQEPTGRVKGVRECWANAPSGSHLAEQAGVLLQEARERYL